MILFHGTDERLVNRILFNGFEGTDYADDIKEESGYEEIVFFSDDIELLEGYEAIIECRILDDDAYNVKGRWLLDSEWVAHPNAIIPVKVHFADGEVVEAHELI